jgi:hypothetical protein
MQSPFRALVVDAASRHRQLDEEGEPVSGYRWRHCSSDSPRLESIRTGPAIPIADAHTNLAMMRPLPPGRAAGDQTIVLVRRAV